MRYFILVIVSLLALLSSPVLASVENDEIEFNDDITNVYATVLHAGIDTEDILSDDEAVDEIFINAGYPIYRDLDAPKNSVPNADLTRVYLTQEAGIPFVIIMVADGEDLYLLLMMSQEPSKELYIMAFGYLYDSIEDGTLVSPPKGYTEVEEDKEATPTSFF